MAGAKTILGIIGVLMLLMGGIWVLQGLNVSFAPKSFMTSDINWSYRGMVFAVIGLALLVWSLRSAAGWQNIVGGFGALIGFSGVVWACQGLNLLPNTGMMAGDATWAIRGGVALVIGLAMIAIVSRAPKVST